MFHQPHLVARAVDFSPAENVFPTVHVPVAAPSVHHPHRIVSMLPDAPIVLTTETLTFFETITTDIGTAQPTTLPFTTLTPNTTAIGPVTITTMSATTVVLTTTLPLANSSTVTSVVETTTGTETPVSVTTSAASSGTGVSASANSTSTGAAASSSTTESIETFSFTLPTFTITPTGGSSSANATSSGTAFSATTSGNLLTSLLSFPTTVSGTGVSSSVNSTSTGTAASLTATTTTLPQSAVTFPSIFSGTGASSVNSTAAFPSGTASTVTTLAAPTTILTVTTTKVPVSLNSTVIGGTGSGSVGPSSGFSTVCPVSTANLSTIVLPTTTIPSVTILTTLTPTTTFDIFPTPPPCFTPKGGPIHLPPGVDPDSVLRSTCDTSLDQAALCPWMCDRLGDGLGFVECAQMDLTGESFGTGFFQYLECIECLVPCYEVDPLAQQIGN